MDDKYEGAANVDLVELLRELNVGRGPASEIIPRAIEQLVNLLEYAIKEKPELAGESAWGSIIHDAILAISEVSLFCTDVNIPIDVVRKIPQLGFDLRKEIWKDFPGESSDREIIRKMYGYYNYDESGKYTVR